MRPRRRQEPGIDGDRATFQVRGDSNVDRLRRTQMTGPLIGEGAQDPVTRQQNTPNRADYKKLGGLLKERVGPPHERVVACRGRPRSPSFEW